MNTTDPKNMANSGSICGRLLRPALASLLLVLSAPLWAAPGFVAATKVSRTGDMATVTVTFNCRVNYLGHDPVGRGDQLRIQLEPTSICSSTSPFVADVREQYRPPSAAEAKLIDIEYDGGSSAGPILSLNFSENVGFGLDPFTNANTVIVRVFLKQSAVARSRVEPRTGTIRRVKRARPPLTQYVINLESSRRPPATADMPRLQLDPGTQLMVSEALIEGRTWYRLRLGFFPSTEAAARKLATLRSRFPTAWIGRAQVGGKVTAVEKTLGAPLPTKRITPVVPAARVATTSAPIAIDASSDAKMAALMSDGRRAMTAGELSRAVQIYTKVLQQPANEYQPEAQEFLALARERNGQIAHAKAEYQRYLALYPDNEGAARVSQRLSVLLSQSGARPNGTVAANGSMNTRQQPSLWNVRYFLSQFYRRDVNQVNDNDEIVSQSALYSDINVDARRRGERFDFSSRLTAGYRKNFIEETSANSGNDLRVSYAYADLADSKYGVRGRIGRQSRNTGGVLGRFDGANISYQATDRLKVDAVAGKPVTSTFNGVDDSRTFYGVSSNFGPIGDNLDLGVFLLQQNVEGMIDRQAIGGELRYFGADKSLWGLIDYDTSFHELGSLFLQGSWRLPSQLTLTGLVDRRRSPFLSTSNALIGQSVTSFDQLSVMLTEDDIRQLALDRAAKTTTFSLGVSRPLSPKLQINLNASHTSIDATPDSGGVMGMPSSTYQYYSTDLVASSLLKEGDVSLLGLRYSNSDSTRVYTINLDTRYPIGRSLRFNPRLRVDYRQIKSDSSIQWIYTPGLRLQYRAGRTFRINLEAGKQFSHRDMNLMSVDRDSYFVNLGYQLFY